MVQDFKKQKQKTSPTNFSYVETGVTCLSSGILSGKSLNSSKSGRGWVIWNQHSKIWILAILYTSCMVDKIECLQYAPYFYGIILFNAYNILPNKVLIPHFIYKEATSYRY